MPANSAVIRHIAAEIARMRPSGIYNDAIAQPVRLLAVLSNANHR